MQIKFWGVRGSIPVAGEEYMKYGGNTSCIELTIQNDDNIYIFDAGTGIRKLGEKIIRDFNQGKVSDIYIFITHSHWDHIMGLPYFLPIYNIKSKIHFLGPYQPNTTLQDVVFGLYQYNYFPVTFKELPSKIDFKELKEETIKLNNLTISTKIVNHPVTTIAYKIEHNEKTFLYTGDNEPYQNFIDNNDKTLNEFVQNANKSFQEFLKNVDLLIADSQYTEKEYEQKHGWGHSTYERVYQLAKESQVKKIAFFHHDPGRTDLELDEIKFTYLQNLKKEYNNQYPKDIIVAQERECIEV